MYHRRLIGICLEMGCVSSFRHTHNWWKLSFSKLIGSCTEITFPHRPFQLSNTEAGNILTFTLPLCNVPCGKPWEDSCWENWELKEKKVQKWGAHNNLSRKTVYISKSTIPKNQTQHSRSWIVAEKIKRLFVRKP